MKKLIVVTLILVLILGSAVISFFCGNESDENMYVSPTPIFTEQPILTDEPTMTPSPQPAHSPLYIQGISVDDVITFFNEVCLDAEFVNSGNPSNVQKWDSKILYIILGDPTGEDKEKLYDFVKWLNGIDGFPGMEETDNPYDAALKIHFCDNDTMIDLLGDNFYGMDGGVTFWYDYDVIYDATVCVRTDLNQTVRNSVILEEIYNGLGPVQDTDLREDSIIYSGYSEPQELTEMDELILKLLYHPDIKPGMDSQACEVVIRDLYY